MKKDKKEKSSGLFKASDPKKFKELFNESAPFYKELSKGESVKLDPKSKHTISWLDHNYIIQL